MTGGDAMKAKQLSDLLSLGVHAGERREEDNIDKIAKHKRDVVVAIVDESLGAFVHDALHYAGGAGRYPNKVRKA